MGKSGIVLSRCFLGISLPLLDIWEKRLCYVDSRGKFLLKEESIWNLFVTFILHANIEELQKEYIAMLACIRSTNYIIGKEEEEKYY